MPLQLSNQLKCMNETKKSSTSILRSLINGIIYDQQIFAQSNAESLLKSYSIIDKACQGIIKFINIL